MRHTAGHALSMASRDSMFCSLQEPLYEQPTSSIRKTLHAPACTCVASQQGWCTLKPGWTEVAWQCDAPTGSYNDTHRFILPVNFLNTDACPAGPWDSIGFVHSVGRVRLGAVHRVRPDMRSC